MWPSGTPPFVHESSAGSRAVKEMRDEWLRKICARKPYRVKVGVSHKQRSGHGVRASRVCIVTGEEYRVVVSILQWSKWKVGELIQDVMPELSDGDREFLISNLTPNEWRVMTGQQPILTPKGLRGAWHGK